MRGFIIGLLVLCAISFQSKAQDQSNNIERFVYGIENITSLEQINTLERNVLALSFISELKFDIKMDQGKARMQFSVVQAEPISEGRDNIDLAEIKRLIIEAGMTPIECTKVN
jgi:hypothetical protein